jgi:hypothetical protein
MRRELARIGTLLTVCALTAGVAHAEPRASTRDKRRHRPHKVQLTQLGNEGSRADLKAAAKPATPAAPAAESAPPAAAKPEEPASAPRATDTNPAVRVSTKLDKSTLQVGEIAKLAIEVDAPSTIEPSLPEQAFGGLELVDRRLTTKIEGDRTRTTFELDLLALNAGDANVPALDIRLVGQNGELSKARADAQSVRVSSLIANEPNAEPKPATKPLSVMQDDYTLAWVGAGLLAIALIAAATLLLSRWLKRRPKPVVPPPPPRPPWELAVERLEQLARAREQLFADQHGEQFIDGVSDALREYLGRRYGFDGLERTTEELMTTMERLRPPQLSLSALAMLLEQCDLVKFARLSPDAAQGEEMLQGALGLVRSTTPSGHSLPPMPMQAQGSSR